MFTRLLGRPSRAWKINAFRGFRLCVVSQQSSAAGHMTGTSTSNKRAVLWFRNDLRLHDNVIVHEAARRVKAGSITEVLPVFCFDPQLLRASKWGNAKTGPIRAQFLLESVLDLKQRLQGLGSDLLIHLGRPEEVLPGLAGSEGTQGSTVVLAGAEVTSEEITVERKVRSAVAAVGGKLELHWGPSLYHLEDLPFRGDLADMPDVFTPFKNACESKCQVRPCLPTPGKGALPLPAALPQQLREQLDCRPASVEEFNCLLPPGHKQLATTRPDPRGVLDFKGGETAALARLKYYLWDTDLIATYFDTRNGMVGGDYSSKFAPWLSHGCLSPRTVYHEVKRYEAQRVANKSTYWVIFELIWRDYFRFYALKHGNSIFFPEGPVGRPVRWAADPEALRRWKEGRTGWPLVDANMRELAATGFMSNRGRQNVASFLALDLGLDWRLGADWFEHLLIDYDVPSNWGNWVAAAGLTGGRVNKFNITKQSKDYDLNGDYIRRWLPELARVPASRIHEPWLMSRQEQESYGVQIGSDYPAPIKPTGRPAGGGSSSGRGRSGDRGGGHSKGSSGAYRGMTAAGGRGGAAGGRGGGRSFRARSTFDMYG